MTGLAGVIIIVWFVLAVHVLTQLTCKCIFMAGQRAGRWIRGSLPSSVSHQAPDTTAELDELDSHDDRS